MDYIAHGVERKKCYDNGLLVPSQELQKEGNVANPTKVQPKSFFHPQHALSRLHSTHARF